MKSPQNSMASLYSWSRHAHFDTPNSVALATCYFLHECAYNFLFTGLWISI